MIRPLHLSLCAVLLIATVGSAQQPDNFTLQRKDRTIVLEPYAPNIIRVVLNAEPGAKPGAPGYGFVAKPAPSGWTHQQDANGDDVLRSGSLVVRVGSANTPGPHTLPLDKLNNDLRHVYFYGYGSGAAHNDLISISTPAGKPLVTLWRWSMRPNKSTEVDKQFKLDPGFRISATFDSPAGEHYYGLGQQQQGVMDLRDHRIPCWHDYGHIGGENVCVPFLVSTAGYGIVWDNPSKTTVDLGFNNQNVWESDVADQVSFFVIAGDKADDLYQGYRELTGVTHLLPRGVYGYIQSKAIYPTQEQALAVAEGYRDRNLPLDVLVVDFLNMTRQGEMDLDPKRWPDAAAMNKELHGMGIHTLLSVWPHYSDGTQFYDMLRDKGWLIHKADGTPDRGGYTKEVGPNIDTTNPEAARWWWDKIRDRYIKPYGFDYIWLDETEPDVDPANDVFHIGSGLRYYNVYPLFHTASVYDGFRRDFGDSRRVFSLSRAGYLGAQANGTVMWSSDIVASWDMLKRSIPAGLNFTASGMAYWDTDIAGFFSPQIRAGYKPAHKPLIDASDVAPMLAGYDDYAELFVRWFQWGTFHPVMRAHGEREHNEVWSYGKQAEPILSKYLRLRYQLVPYTYSLAYGTYKTGAPYMRALFMDFPGDPNALNVPDEYMYGPAILVAPVTEQGATSRKVYLPAGSDWYNYWTNERLKGGQTITADAPIDTLPLFVRAGSILPLGSEVLSAQQDKQAIAKIRIYPGVDADFTLYSDDGTTYNYEKDGGSITKLHWDDAHHKLTHTGARAWTTSDASTVQVMH